MSSSCDFFFFLPLILRENLPFYFTLALLLFIMQEHEKNAFRHPNGNGMTAHLLNLGPFPTKSPNDP